MAPLVTLLTSALCIWLAQMAYWLPLKRRENYRLRFLLDFVATVPFAQVIPTFLRFVNGSLARVLCSSTGAWLRRLTAS